MDLFVRFCTERCCTMLSGFAIVARKVVEVVEEPNSGDVPY